MLLLTHDHLGRNLGYGQNGPIVVRTIRIIMWLTVTTPVAHTVAVELVPCPVALSNEPIALSRCRNSSRSRPAVQSGHPVLPRNLTARGCKAIAVRGTVQESPNGKRTSSARHSPGIYLRRKEKTKD